MDARDSQGRVSLISGGGQRILFPTKFWCQGPNLWLTPYGLVHFAACPTDPSGPYLRVARIQPRLTKEFTFYSFPRKKHHS